MNPNYQFSWRELARQLTEDLLSTPSTALAGVDALGKQYKVSRLTVKRALSHLEELGIIAPAERGKKRQVDLKKLRKVASLQNMERVKNRVVFLAVFPESNPTYPTRFHFEIFHKLCDQERLLLTYIQIPRERAELHALLRALQPRGAILYCVPPAVSETVISLAIPAIQLGGQEGLELPPFLPPALSAAFEQPLSLVTTIRVLSPNPAASTASTICPTVASACITNPP